MNILSLDFGQSQDYTALAISEHTRVQNVGHLVARHLHRFPLGTSYPSIIESVKAMMQDPRLRNAVVICDATGVGRAVLDLMRLAGLKPIAVTITGGTTETQEGMNFHVPKKNLVSAVAVMLETERLKVADGLEFAPLLRHELGNFKAKITLAGNTTFEAWRESDHDDLVIAVALAAWWANRWRPRVENQGTYSEEQWF
jgi:hypothetical protein